MPTVDEIAATLAQVGAVVPAKRIKLDFGSEGAIVLDGHSGGLGDPDVAVDATITLSFANFMKLVDGSLSGTVAFMMGKMKVDGDMAVALQLQSVTKALRG